MHFLQPIRFKVVIRPRYESLTHGYGEGTLHQLTGIIYDPNEKAKIQQYMLNVLNMSGICNRFTGNQKSKRQLCGGNTERLDTITDAANQKLGS